LVWLTGNLEFFTLRDRLQSDPVFAGRMIRYLSSVIKCSIDTFTGDLGDIPAPVTPSARDPESDCAFGTRLHRDANAVASKRQMHSQSHNATCFKYAKPGSRECRFLFPRPLVSETSTFPVKVGNMWIRRHQVPMSPAFALTEYKVQGSTYRYAVLDLARRTYGMGEDAVHSRHCSSYNVQLSRLQTMIIEQSLAARAHHA
jgi:hypothetical protein